MKIILTGSSGFIGREVLKQCLQNKSITSIVALSRRNLPSTDNPKLKVTILEDFTKYPEPVLQDIEGAEACIWCLGKPRIPDNETARKVSIDYTFAGVRAFAQVFAQRPNISDTKAKKFRFIYMSGLAVERDQTKKLWFMQDYRRIRGQVENELLSYAKAHQDTFESYILRPGMVLPKETSLKSLISSLMPSVKLGILAQVTINIALNGNVDQIVENAAIGQVGS